jgi:hypothetical protein
LAEYGFNIKVYDDNILNLYVTSHFGFKKTCLKKRKTAFNITQLTEISDVARKIQEWSLWEKILGFTFGLFSFIDYIDSPFVIFENLLKNVVTFVELLVTYLKVLLYDDPYEDKMECSDDISNSNYNIMIVNISSSGQYIFKFFLSFIIVFSSRLVTLIVEFSVLCTKKGKKGKMCCCFCSCCEVLCCPCCEECCCKVAENDINVINIVDDKTNKDENDSSKKSKINKKDEKNESYIIMLPGQAKSPVSSLLKDKKDEDNSQKKIIENDKEKKDQAKKDDIELKSNAF